jgi:hypothetical protein
VSSNDTTPDQNPLSAAGWPTRCTRSFVKNDTDQAPFAPAADIGGSYRYPSW